jgi:hypothetical protein
MVFFYHFKELHVQSPVLPKIGQRYKFKNLQFWAEEGVICIEDQEDGELTAVMCKEFAYRARAINEEAKITEDRDIRKMLFDGVLDMYEAFKDAKRQGDPSDPEVIRHRVRERRRAMLLTSAKAWS